MNIRPATAHDLDTIVELRSQRSAWLAARGSDQWSSAGLDADRFRQRVSASIAAGETWMATDETGADLGTIAVDDYADPGLWAPEERDDAVIVHRMITRVDAAGLGVGTALLDQADRVARHRGRRWVRLDAWTTNIALHQLYKRHGFRHVRTITNARTASAALFERKVVQVLGDPPISISGSRSGR